MPAVLPDGLAIGAVLPREDPRDAVVLPVAAAGRDRAAPAAAIDRGSASLNSGRAPSIGTSSVRRMAQLTRLFPSARFVPIRGNLDTRLRKLDAGEYDALVLAAAGLRRLQHARVSRPYADRMSGPGAGPRHRRDRNPRER